MKWEGGKRDEREERSCFLTTLARIHSQVIPGKQPQTGCPDMQLLKHLLPMDGGRGRVNRARAAANTAHDTQTPTGASPRARVSTRSTHLSRNVSQSSDILLGELDAKKEAN